MQPLQEKIEYGKPIITKDEYASLFPKAIETLLSLAQVRFAERSPAINEVILILGYVDIFLARAGVESRRIARQRISQAGRLLQVLSELHCGLAGAFAGPLQVEARSSGFPAIFGGTLPGL